MTKHAQSAPALTFHDTTFHPVAQGGQQWLPATEIAAALGYANDNAISRIYARRKDEFTHAMSQSVKMTLSGNLTKEVRIFSLRGAHLIGMFARTERAAEFRRWVLDILDREAARKALPAPDFDLRAVMLEGNITPTVALPADVQAAINRKAWAMAHDAYELCREHLARRVAYRCEYGHPQRLLDQKQALAVVADTTLDMALAPRHHNALNAILRQAETMARHAGDNLAKMREELKGPTQ